MKFYIYTLGCKVNTYESNVMRDKLLNAGYIESKEDDSDIYIINTCFFINYRFVCCYYYCRMEIF